MKEKILIVGGAGYVGSMLAKKLLRMVIKLEYLIYLFMIFNFKKMKT